MATTMLGGVARLFRKTASQKDSPAQEHRARLLLHPHGPYSPDLNPTRVRVVVFRDDKAGKVPLFDSQIHCDATDDTGEKEAPMTRSLCDMRSGEMLERSTSSVPGSCPVTWRKGRPPLTKRPSSDSELLGEMIFGSMPMKVAGNTIKVHYIRSTEQVMLTKVFSQQRRPAMTICTLTDFTDSCPLPSELSNQGIEHSLESMPKNHSFVCNVARACSPHELKPRSSSLNVPISRPNSSLSAHSLSPSPSPQSHSHSPVNSFGALNLPYPTVNSSLTRRILRSRSTSLEYGSELYRKVLKPLDQQPPRKGRKYGIGVIICLSELSSQQIKHFQEFLFSHFTLIDAHLEQLKEGVEEACHLRNGFIALVTRAYQRFLEDFLALYRTPRIHSPVWLSLVSQEERRRAICMQFVPELGSAIVQLDTKEAKFFLSSLLTAVLSHHLAWVFTVNRSYDNRTSKMETKSLAVLAESHPYNPLWAQLGDMYGSVSNPLRITRTIVTGQQSAVVMRLLYVLTYFIRCCEVQPGLEAHRTKSNSLCPSDLGPSCSTSNLNLSQNDLHDFVRGLDDETDVFQESRASSVTVISDHEHHSFASPVPSERETPVVKPHPFGFKSQGGSDTLTRKASQTDTDSSFEAQLHSRGSVGSCQSLKLGRQKSNSPIKSGSLEICRPHTSQGSCSSLPLKKSSPLLTSSRHSIATAGQVTGHVTCGTAPTRIQPEVWSGVFSRKLASCRNDPPSDQDSIGTTEDLPTECHFKTDRESCATLASCESMGRCPLGTSDYIQFDPSKKYHLSEDQPPVRNLSFESLISDVSQLSRNTSFNSLSIRSSLTSSANYPLSLGAPPPNPSPPIHHQVCGSLDSGYDQSLSVSSYTDSSRDSCTTDSLLLSSAGQGRTEVSKMCYNPGALVPSIECVEPDQSFDSLRGEFLERGGVNGYTYGRLEALSTAACHSASSHSSDATCVPLDVTDTLNYYQQTSSGSSHSSVFAQPDQEGSIGSGRSVDGSLGGGKDERELEDLPPMYRRRSGAFSQPNRHIRTIQHSLGAHERTCVDPSHSVTQVHVPRPAPVGKGAPSVSERKAEELALPSPRASREVSPAERTLVPGYTLPARPAPEPTSLLQLPTGRYTPELPAPRYVGSWRPMCDSDSDSGRCTKTSSLPPCDVLTSQDDACSSSSTRASSHDRDSESPGLMMMNVEESLLPNSSLLAERLHRHQQLLWDGGMHMPEHFKDFTEVDLPSIDDYHLQFPEDENRSHDQSNPAHSVPDFGHSLLVGHSPSYLPDFVLHGTTSRPEDFEGKLLSDLQSMVKHPIIDEPVDHGVAIIADTDTWTCKLVMASKSVQTNDVVIGSGNVHPSRYVRQLLSSVRGLWQMGMPPEFCLSHLEDRLLELNEKGQMLAQSLHEFGSERDWQEVLPRSLDSMSVHASDMSLVMAVAAVHSTDPDISYRLNNALLQRSLRKHGN